MSELFRNVRFWLIRNVRFPAPGWLLWRMLRITASLEPECIHRNCYENSTEIV